MTKTKKALLSNPTFKEIASLLNQRGEKVFDRVLQVVIVKDDELIINFSWRASFDWKDMEKMVNSGWFFESAKPMVTKPGRIIHMTTWVRMKTNPKRGMAKTNDSQNILKFTTGKQVRVETEEDARIALLAYE